MDFKETYLEKLPLRNLKKTSLETKSNYRKPALPYEREKTKHSDKKISLSVAECLK